MTSYSTRTSPAVRGKCMLDQYLGSPPPPPPPDVPALKENGEDGAAADHGSREDGGAPQEPGVCGLSRADGSAGVRARELYGDREMANS